MSNGGQEASGEVLQEKIDEAIGFLQNGNPERAKSAALALLENAPDNDEILYLLAVAHRYLGEHAQAISVIDKLKSVRPGFGRSFQEEGYLRLATGEDAKAIVAFQNALKLNNSLVASWKMLAQLHAKAGDATASAAALAEHDKLAALPAELLSVRNMMAEGRLLVAERVCRYFMRSNPKHIEGMRLLADLGVRAGVLDDAEFILESAVAFEPENVFARFDYMNVLYRRQKYAQSFAQSELLLNLEPENLDFEIAHANQSVAIGEFEPALEIYRRAVEQMPANAELHLVRAHALKTIGRVPEAIESYRKAYDARPAFGDAYWSLANLKTYIFTEDEVAAMEEHVSASSTPTEDRVHFCFALGKHREDQSDYAAAFAQYQEGNRLRREQLQYDADDMSLRLRQQEEHVDQALIEERSGSGCDAPDPIFILGLPRAGSTLLEQILASHSQVEGTLELPNISSLAFELGGRRRVNQDPAYPANLAQLPLEKLREFGEAFIEDTRVHRSGAPFFIDKMPNNFRHIGLIHLILPNAKIIDARRHPMACCFSGFKQLFASGQEFTYGLKEIGQYYRDYVSLMDHWDNVLPGKILRVQYEDVVADTESQIRRILDYCGLPFEQACVDFHQTERSVRTPSSEQVRQPIFKSGLEQWRNFDPWLDPLKDALGPVLERYPLAESK